MRVIEISAFGPPEGLAVGERSVPVPSSEESWSRWRVPESIARMSCSVAGITRPPRGPPTSWGLEVSGIVAAVGDGVSRWQGWRPRLWSRHRWWVCGVLCRADVPVLPVPGTVDLVDAAALPEACLTVWTNVFDSGRLQAGERFLVHGGSSGIGTTAIQLARLWGADVFATAGTAEKCAACERLGATRAINYREVEFAHALRATTDGHGVDVILDMVGGPYLKPNLESLAVEGRLVLIGLMGGATAEIDLATLMSRRLVLTGSTLRSRSVSQKAAITKCGSCPGLPWIAASRFQPVIHARFSLDEAAKAHRTMEASSHIGKLLLQPSP